MNEAYVISMRQHVQEQLETLNELAEAIKLQPLRKIERLAAERSLQIMIEAAIGVAKHCCKKAGKTHSGDAYKNLLTAHDLLNSNIPHATLKGAAGMRNAIVHDYLNLDWARIEAVIVNKQYEALGEFIGAGLDYLSH
ncbi:type VII toxin-antitoxin system HepT family RNase toxin [Bacterioplanoides sp.]|uniref:type VII toxin-antitoxin system HepT family RNase toxin n=1 Tax=Bacterioplanoides sp. TaxID=2066072 RepID=UPI003B5AC767